MNRCIHILAVAVILGITAFTPGVNYVRADAPATSQPASQPAEALSPLEALRTTFQAGSVGDGATFREGLHAANAEEQTLADALRDIVQAVGVVRKAGIAKFGREAGKGIFYPWWADQNSAQYELGKGSQERITGETASVGVHGDTFPMIRVDGRWKFWLAKWISGKPADQVPAAQARAKRVNGVAGDVGAGKFKSEAEVQKALLAAMNEN